MIAYFNLFLWLTEVKLYPIMLVQNVMKCIDVLSPDYLTDIIIDVVAALLQLGLRLYLKFVKKNNSSNELLSIKFSERNPQIIEALVIPVYQYVCISPWISD